MPRSSRRRSAQSTHAGSGQVRLIAGRWRGRYLPVVTAPGLRPSGDRLRETLFNWLQFDLPGARCLDLFAGSGALGFEAASRGASHVDLVESHAQAAHNLLDQVHRLDADRQVSVHQLAAEAFLQLEQDAYDLVFIDPPFDMACQRELLRQLQESDCLTAEARIYVEAPSAYVMPDAIEGFDLHRTGTFGEVVARLYIACR